MFQASVPTSVANQKTLPKNLGSTWFGLAGTTGGSSVFMINTPSHHLPSRLDRVGMYLYHCHCNINARSRWHATTNRDTSQRSGERTCT